MAKTQETEPLADLKQEAIDHLDNIGSALEEAQKDLDAISKLGMDVSRLQERINWGKKAREIILERYGRKPE